MPPEESPKETPQTLPHPPRSDHPTPLPLGRRARAWLTLLALLGIVFFMAWLLGFFNV
ncbi:MAG: hypothetical protein SNJ58_10995 [Aggregatilineales bacterium]